MLESCKGVRKLYEDLIQLITNDKENLYEWIFENPNDLIQGQICEAIVWYEKKRRWYLEEAKYEPFSESQSTWYAKPLRYPFPPSPENKVMRYFSLEKDEYLITHNCKNRTIILINKYIDDWFNPINTLEHIQSWLCIPVFKYRDKHTQNYVLSDQKLECPNRFYLPPLEGSNPGLKNESAVRYHSIQMINEKYIKPVKIQCRKKPL